MENSLLQKFEEWLTRYRADRNPADNTIRGLRSTMTRFLIYCQSQGRASLDEITREDIIAWLNGLIDARTSTRKASERYITVFFNRALGYGMRCVKMAEIGYRGPADVPRATLKGFSQNEIFTMMKNIRKLGNRESVIFYILSLRPMRQNELVKLKVQDVNPLEKTLTINKSKNKKSRVISYPQEAHDAMAELIRDKAPGDLVFGIKTRAMNKVINGILDSLGIYRNGRSSHAFRHTVIVKMLRQQGIDPALIAELAGNTTKTIYEHYDKCVSVDELRDAERKMDIAARIKNKGKEG